MLVPMLLANGHAVVGFDDPPDDLLADLGWVPSDEGAMNALTSRSNVVEHFFGPPGGHMPSLSGSELCLVQLSIICVDAAIEAVDPRDRSN